MKKFLGTRIAVAFALWASMAVCIVSSTYAAGTFARASSEPAIGGLTTDEYWNQQQQLHEWLMSELPVGILDTAIQVPMTQQDRHAIVNDTTPFPRPHRVGIVKRVGRTIQLWRGGRAAKASSGPAYGVMRVTADGGFVWAVALESEGALALRVHLSDVSLPDTADIYFFNLDGQAHGPYRGQDTFWSNSVMGSQGIVLVRQFGPLTTGTRPISISVSSLGNIGERFAAAAEDELCSYNASCIENAEAQHGQPAKDLKAATAYIEWAQGPWIYSCSGGLLADNDDSGQIPYFLTANHCLKSNKTAESLELFWNYTTSIPDACMGPGDSMTMGGIVKATSVQGDFTLLELNQAPPAGSVFMGWSNTDITTTSGVALNRVHHPSGAPQSYSTHITDPGFAACGGLSSQQFIYSQNTFGSIEGGSSGSLVANDAGEVVGQLYGVCGSNLDDICDSDSWRTVDGAFAFYFDKVAGFLDSGSSCEPTPEAEAEACDDGIDNDCNSYIDCDDSECSEDPVCDSTTCEPKNGMCSESSDCCSDICKRNGRCR